MTSARVTGAGVRRAGRRALGLLATTLLGATVAACGAEVESGATPNPLAPGRPGTGNPTEFVFGQPESPTESPQLGGARALVPEGATGRGGATDSPGRVQNRLVLPHTPGAGLDGGLGGPDAADGAARRRTNEAS